MCWTICNHPIWSEAFAWIVKVLNSELRGEILSIFKENEFKLKSAWNCFGVALCQHSTFSLFPVKYLHNCYNFEGNKPYLGIIKSSFVLSICTHKCINVNYKWPEVWFIKHTHTSRLLRTSWQFCVDKLSLTFIK